MFYAHFVLSKKGPLARIWLAAHWDKKLTKAHVFETNIDSSVDAILQPKVKLALRTSGHLLLGVVRIYSRKAKYLLADCNEAFVKIKMAFRPGVVDLPEENREAAVTAITLQENFHDFDTTLADLNDIDVQAQFAVNQSRPEEITMREDIGNITLVGDDGFGDVGFDDREILRDVSHMDDSLYKSPEPPSIHLTDKDDKTLESSLDKPMDVDLPPPVMDDGFGGAVDDGFVGGADDDDDDDDDNFGGGVDHEFFGGNFMDAGGLFEDPPLPEVSMAPEVDAQGPSASTAQAVKDVFPTQGPAESASVPEPAAGAASGAPAHERTTLVHNEEEEFALEPIDVTSVQGTEKRGKRKRKLIVDDQKGIPSESMKMQLSDTSDIVSTLDLAPPTKKLMHWKETGGVEKLFALPGRPIHSKAACKLYGRNLITKPMTEEEAIFEEERPDFESPEIARADQTIQDLVLPEQNTIIEEPLIGDVSTMSKQSNRSVRELETPQHLPQPAAAPQQTPVDQSMLNTTDILATSNMQESMVEMPTDPSMLEPIDMGPKYLDDEPPSIAPFSVPPPSVAPPSVAPPSVAPAFEDLEPEGHEAMPETEEQEERRLNKRSQQMQYALESAFNYNEVQSFKDLTRRHNRKQVCSKFYTLLTLKKLEVLNLQQSEPFGDILLTKGPQFGLAV